MTMSNSCKDNRMKKIEKRPKKQGPKSKKYVTKPKNHGKIEKVSASRYNKTIV